MNNCIQEVIDEVTSLLTLTDQVLNEWTGEGNLQFPVLLGMLAVKMNWDEKQVRESDPLIRYYIRRNPDWHVTRGAHGGIMRSSEKQRRDAVKAAKELAKKQVQAAIDAKMTSTDLAEDNSSDSEELE